MPIKDILNNYNSEHNVPRGSTIEEALQATLSSVNQTVIDAGDELPDVTPSDEGKVLKVNQAGQWVIGDDESGGEEFVISATYKPQSPFRQQYAQEQILSINSSELKAALDAKQEIVLEIIPVAGQTGKTFRANSFYQDWSSLSQYWVSFIVITGVGNDSVGGPSYVEYNIHPSVYSGSDGPAMLSIRYATRFATSAQISSINTPIFWYAQYDYTGEIGGASGKWVIDNVYIEGTIEQFMDRALYVRWSYNNGYSVPSMTPSDFKLQDMDDVSLEFVTPVIYLSATDYTYYETEEGSGNLVDLYTYFPWTPSSTLSPRIVHFRLDTGSMYNAVLVEQ